MSGTLVAVYLFSVGVVLFVAWRLVAALKDLTSAVEFWGQKQAACLGRIEGVANTWAARYTRRKKKIEAKEAETP